MLSKDEISTLILVDLASDTIPVDQIMNKIQLLSPDEQKTLLHELQQQEINLLHNVLLNYDKVSEQELITFIQTFSQYINLNALNDNNQTILHIIAQKDLANITNVLFNQNLNFSTQPDLYAEDKQCNKPTELAGVNTKSLFNSALRNDFIERIVLVTSFATNSVANYLTNTNQLIDIDYNNPPNTVINVLAKREGLITKDGTIGGHLEFNNNVYKNSFVDRPHTHWSWNQLCQANSGGNWEQAVIAVIEPLKQFSNVEGCVPYDTTIMGPHQLSEQSTILVPNHAVQAITARLKENGGTFKGQIKGFDALRLTLREAVRAEIVVSYPKASKLLNGNQKDISLIAIEANGSNARQHNYDFKYGYFPTVSMKINGVIRPLMSGESNIKLPVYREYSQGKHVGMHQGSPTDIENDPIFKKLNAMSKDFREIPINMDSLVGMYGEKNIRQLCITKTYFVYRNLRNRFNQDTGAHGFADYLLKKAIMADFRSFHYQFTEEKEYSPIHLKQMVESGLDNLVKALENGLRISDLSEYRNIIQTSYMGVIVQPESSNFSIWQSPPNLPQMVQNELQNDAQKTTSDAKDSTENDDGMKVS